VPRRVGALALDPHRQEVRFSVRPLQLARYEYLLLTHLAADPEYPSRFHAIAPIVLPG
jgi:DNA-binding response OmpR family regulator